MTQVPWFMYQNRLGPSGGIYYPSFVPCFVVLHLKTVKASPTLANAGPSAELGDSPEGLSAQKMLF